MRKKTTKEIEITGKVNAVLRQLKIDNETAGCTPLIDIISYAHAFPEENLEDIIDYLFKVNNYVGIYPESIKSVTREKEEMRPYPSLVHTIKTVIEAASPEDLKALQLDKLEIIIKGNLSEREEEFLAEIGEKYRKYPDEKRITLYFIKKILKNL